jgi:hypothetical protein
MSLKKDSKRRELIAQNAQLSDWINKNTEKQKCK